MIFRHIWFRNRSQPLSVVRLDGILCAGRSGSGQTRVQVSRGEEAGVQDNFQGAPGHDVHGYADRKRQERNEGMVAISRQTAGRFNPARRREGSVIARGLHAPGGNQAEPGFKKPKYQDR